MSAQIVIAVVNLKGGSTKTTTAAHLGSALHEADLRVLGVDADGENQHLAAWQTAGNWPWSVVGMAVPNLHKQLPGVVGDRYDVVVIDTPPMKEHRGVVLSAVRLATHVVVPLAPTGIEYQQLPAVQSLINDAADLRPDGSKPVVAVLLTRCVPGASSTGTYRDLITGDGFTVLKAQVNRLERFAQAFGDPIVDAAKTAYGDAADELLELEVSA